MDSAKDENRSKRQSASSPKLSKSGSLSKSPPKTPTSAVSRGSARGTGAGKEISPSRGSNRPQVNAKASARSNKKEEPSLMGNETRTEEIKPLPEGCLSIFLSGASQKIFEIVAGENVTEASPFKLINKEDIFKDFYNRAGVSDFSVVKDIVKNYPTDEILLVYDPDFKYGNNFYMATTEEAKQLLLNPPPKEEEIEKEEVIHRYKPPSPRPWICLGSDKEILAEKVVESRPRIQVSLVRPRKAFGTPVKLSSRNCTEIKMGYVELPTYEDKSFGVQIVELDTGVHNASFTQEGGTQTEWKYPKNAHTQYHPLRITPEELANIEKSTYFTSSLTKTEPLFTSSLLDNEIMNFLYDDYGNLSEGDAFTARVDNTLKEFQSFTDLEFSKDKAITCIQWHPTIPTVMAMSVADKMDFDTRSKNQAKVTLLPSYIVLWSFVDPIQPQLLLEAPDDIYSFQFRPSDPHIIAGGCVSGQIVLWDIERYTESLQNVKAKLKSRNNMATLPGFDDDDADKKIPIMRYAALSAIEGGHTSAITDLQWVPDHFEVNRMGYSLENKSLKNVQLMTASVDNCIYFWDIRNPKTPQGDQQHTAAAVPASSSTGFVDTLGGSSNPEEALQPVKNVSNIPETFKYLDLSWKPLLKVHLYKSEPGGDHGPTKFSIQEVQGDRSVLESLNSKDAGNQQPPGSVGTNKARTIQKVKTYFYVGSEDGELVYVDWMPQKDQDTGKIQTPKPEFYATHHDGPISTLERCPFDRSLLLVIGGWRWSLWREKVNSGPILKSCTAPKPLTGGAWSPTRPAVFFILRSDGVLEIWDLLDKTHIPTLTQPISSAPLSYISPCVVGKHQLLAIGDLSGTLRVLKVPYRLRSPSPNETNSIGQYIELETRRRQFVVDRWNMREQEKIEQEQEAKRKAGIAPQVLLSEEEQLARMRFEYDAYLQDETAYLRSMGMKDDDDLPAIPVN